MATTSVKASNVTKYNAGGSGDNIIADGYIKTVEKVWLDSYTIAFTSTNATIDIAILPPNKKITSIVVMVETTLSQTNGTISIGWASDADAAGWGDIVSAVVVTHNNTVSTLAFPASGDLGLVATAAQPTNKMQAFHKVTDGTQVTVALKLNNWTMTSGTVKTIVRYT